MLLIVLGCDLVMVISYIYFLGGRGGGITLHMFLENILLGTVVDHI